MTGSGRSGPGRARSGGRGQATVELALGLPIVFLAILLVLQLALIGRDLVLVNHAAREGARALAVTDRTMFDHDVAEHGAREASSALDADRLDVSSSVEGNRVRVRVEYRSVTGLPLVGPLLPDYTVEASVTMRAEADNPWDGPRPESG